MTDKNEFFGQIFRTRNIFFFFVNEYKNLHRNKLENIFFAAVLLIQQ